MNKLSEWWAESESAYILRVLILALPVTLVLVFVVVSVAALVIAIAMFAVSNVFTLLCVFAVLWSVVAVFIHFLMV